MKNTRACSPFVIFFVALLTPAFSQCNQDPNLLDAATRERNVLFDDSHTAKDPAAALPHLHWLLQHAPAMNTNIYIKGAEIFDGLIKKEKHPAKRQVYVDSLMILYDMRTRNCGGEAAVTARKAVSYFMYNYNNAAKVKDILPLMDRALELNGENILDGIVDNYMNAVRVTVVQLKSLSDDEILQRYEKITDIIDSKIKKAPSEEKKERYRKLHDDNLTTLMSIVRDPLDCEFVRKKLGPKFKANPSDVGMAKRIFNFMLKDKCTDDPLWLDAAKAIHGAEKDFGLCKIIGMRYLAMEDYTSSTKYLKEAVTLAKSAADKAEVLSMLGSIEEKKGDKLSARDFYRQAIATDPKKKEYYERIGDLYFNSFDDCAEKKHQMFDRLVYLAAFDMYEKAGNVKKMAAAKSSFPSGEDLHLFNYLPGKSVKVGCWINEETTLRARPRQPGN